MGNWKKPTFVGALLVLWAPGILLIFSAVTAVVASTFLLRIIDFADDFAVWLVSAFPLLSGDIAVYTEATPFVFAGILAYIAPPEKSGVFVLNCVILCIFGWLIYVQFTILVEAGSDGAVKLSTVLEQRIPFPGAGQGGEQENEHPGMAVLRGFSAGIRSFYLAVAAAIIGVKARDGAQS